MFRGKVLAMAVVMMLGLVSQAFAADAGTRPGGARRQLTPEEQQQRMDQFRADMAKRMKETLGATDEEWKVLQPKIEKVQTLQRDARGGGMMGRMGGRRGGNAPADAAANQSAVQKASTNLRTVLDNKDAKPAEIKAALDALRTARAKAKAELEQAQKELKDVLTARQEAQLVSMGMLE